jgi:TonB family protein
VPDQVVEGDVEWDGMRGFLTTVRGDATATPGTQARTGPDGTPGDGIPIDTLPPIDQFIFGVKEPTPILTVSPIYPAMAERAGLTGDLMVRVLVDKLGRVRDAVVIKCSAPGLGFEESARAALMQWAFTPAVQNGHPVPIWINVPVRFAVR